MRQCEREHALIESQRNQNEAVGRDLDYGIEIHHVAGGRYLELLPQ
jgi:hypothetical protein